MLQQGVIEPSSSPWSSPIVLIHNCGLAQQSSALNTESSIKSLVETLPRIDDILSSFRLENVISKKGIAADPEKIKVISSWLRPKNVM